MKNNRIKIIFFLCAFTMLGSITTVNAMKNNKGGEETLNKINDIKKPAIKANILKEKDEENSFDIDSEGSIFNSSTLEDEEEENNEESSFDMDEEGSVFNSSSSEDEEELKIKKHKVKEYLEKTRYYKKQTLNEIKKQNSNETKDSKPEYIDSFFNLMSLHRYSNLFNENNHTKHPELDKEKFAQYLKQLGIIKHIPTASSKFPITIDENLEKYLILVLISNFSPVEYDFNLTNKPVYLTQNNDYIEFLNNMNKLKEYKSYDVNKEMDRISEDINKINTKDNKFSEEQIKEIKNKFNDGKNSVYKEIKKMFEDEIRHIFSKVESINMEIPISDEEVINLMKELDELIKNKLKNVKNKTELKDAVDIIFEEAGKIFKSHKFEKMQSKEIKHIIKEYIKMLRGHLNYFTLTLSYYSEIYKDIKKLKHKDLYNIAWLYFSVAQYIYLTKDSKEVDEAKFLERLQMFNKNKIEYKLDEEDKKDLKKAFKDCNSKLEEYISNFFKEHANYKGKFKKQISKIEKETSNLDEIQKLCYFKEMKDLNFKDLKFKDFNENFSKNPESEENKKYNTKAANKIKQIAENINNLNIKGLEKANINLNKIEKFFRIPQSYSSSKIENITATQILKEIISIKYLNNKIKEIIETAKTTKINLQDILINNKKIDEELITQELKKYNKNDKYISNNLSKATNNYKYYSDYNNNERRNFLIDKLKKDLKNELKNLQNLDNEFKQLKKDIFNLNNSLNIKSTKK